jgi:hypothetical protein
MIRRRAHPEGHITVCIGKGASLYFSRILPEYDMGRFFDSSELNNMYQNHKFYALSVEKRGVI